MNLSKKQTQYGGGQDFYLPILAVFIGSFFLPSVSSAQSCAVGIPESNPAAVYSASGGVVTDNKTGLIWDQCAWGVSGATCGGGSAGSFSWRDTLSVVSTANATVYKGASDWRLPNLKELRSLAEECRASPSINTTVFPSTPSVSFWTNSPTQSFVDYAWTVSFFGGDVFAELRTTLARVRLVRGGR